MVILFFSTDNPAYIECQSCAIGWVHIQVTLITWLLKVCVTHMIRFFMHFIVGKNNAMAYIAIQRVSLQSLQCWFWRWWDEYACPTNRGGSNRGSYVDGGKDFWLVTLWNYFFKQSWSVLYFYVILYTFVAQTRLSTESQTQVIWVFLFISLKVSYTGRYMNMP